MGNAIAAADEYEHILYQEVDDGQIVRIVLNRPETRNAQSRQLLVELDAAYLRAEADDRVRVIVLAGAGTTFSSGHDLRLGWVERDPESPDYHPTWGENGGTRGRTEARLLQEWHYFFQNTLRWRNLRKITIAEVNGPVYAAGLMLMWSCDLIVASDDAVFVDVVGTRLGMCGTEYFAHPWEFGPRKAKELLLTGDALSVDDAYSLGMVSKVFPQDALAASTLEFARRIAALPTMTALLIKESVNQSVDNMGFYNALQASFSLHQVNHSHWVEVHRETGGSPVAAPEDGLPEAGSAAVAEKSSVRGAS